MPSGALSDALTASVLAVPLLSCGRLVVAGLLGRRVDRDVDAVHIVMGVSMAGMLTG